MKKILIVDDSPMIRNLLRDTLNELGYTVCGLAKNGKEGVDLYKKLKPDIMFMDIIMPILDGIGAAKRIKEADKEAKIIMLTAMADDEMIKEAKSAGVDVFLKKPFNSQKILDAISSLK